MNKRLILYVLGMILAVLAALMTLPLLVAALCHEREGAGFLWSIGLSLLLGVPMLLQRPRDRALYAREGYVAVALSWVVISLAGAVPFTVSGVIPNYLDAVFETVSGFTTTGASIVPAVEELPKCMLFWRSFTHLLGGMGVLVFMLALVPLTGGDTIFLLRAESPGPSVSKVVPRMRTTAAILYAIYLGMTLLEILLLLAGGMPLFDSICHAFGTAGTGGFGIKNDSLAGYSTYLQGVISVFMLLFGINFNFYVFLLMRRFKTALRISEVWAYLGIVASAVLIITINVLPQSAGVFPAFHHALFSVSSIITTTGYATADFNLWPELSRILLVILMLVGACAGSTGGGMKVSRIMILIKSCRCEVSRLLHPREVKVMTMDGKRVPDSTVRGVQAYCTAYVLITVGSILLVALDNFDFTTTVTAVIATLNNIGPGLGMVGPAGGFAAFSPLAKVVMTLDMLFGRLELFPLLILLSPRTWRRGA